MSEYVFATVVSLGAAVILAFLAIILRLSGRSDFQFRASGFGVSVSLESDSTAPPAPGQAGTTAAPPAVEP